MKLLQLINAKARQITLFALFLTLSTSLSALSISDWAGSFFGRNVEPQQEELFSEKIEEFGEDHIEPKEYSDNNEGVVEEKIEEKDARGFSGKKQYVRGRSPISLQSISLKNLQPYIEKAKKRLALDEKNPSKKGKQFAQGFIKGVQSSQKEGYKTKSHKKPMGFLKSYISRSGSAKGFSQLLVVSYAFGDFLADQSKQGLPKGVKSMATSWKKLSFQSKGKKIGRFIGDQIQK